MQGCCKSSLPFITGGSRNGLPGTTESKIQYDVYAGIYNFPAFLSVIQFTIPCARYIRNQILLLLGKVVQLSIDRLKDCAISGTTHTHFLQAVKSSRQGYRQF